MTINGSNQAVCKKKIMALKKHHTKNPQQDKSFSAVTALLLVQSFLAVCTLGGSWPCHLIPKQNPVASDGDGLFILCTDDKGNPTE